MQTELENFPEDTGESQASWLLGDSNTPTYIFVEIKCRMERVFQNKPVSFRNFEIWMNPDKLVVWEMYKNNSQSDQCKLTGWSDSKLQVIFQSGDAHRIFIYEETLQFLTCGGITTGTFSLQGYISAFDKWVWTWFLVLILITTAVFLFHHFITGSILKLERLTTQIVFPIVTYLEQGSCTGSNLNKDFYLYFMSEG